MFSMTRTNWPDEGAQLSATNDFRFIADRKSVGRCTEFPNSKPRPAE